MWDSTLVNWKSFSSNGDPLLRIALTFLGFLFFLPSTMAWNDKGHMVIARLAWKQLSPVEQSRIVSILKRHPHYQSFLAEKVPTGYSEDEWVFLRAATWSDWIRSGPKEITRYHVSPIHFINLPLVHPSFTGQPPGPAAQNVINQIANSRLIARNGNQEERAIHLCWLFHLVGDIHQPLHTTNFYSSHFPKGDRGGNLAKVKTAKGGVLQLHSFWDNLLGKDATVAGIGKAVMEIEDYYQEKKAQIDSELQKHRSVDDWAREGYDFARVYAYLDGKLNPANEDDKVKTEDLPVVPDDYATNAGKVARYAMIKAGKRLAAELREIAAAK
jgi:hypothetical protein